MEYNVQDIRKIAELLSGNGGLQLPQYITFGEPDLYEFCWCKELVTKTLDDNLFNIEMFTDFLKQLADNDQFVSFVDYYLNSFLDKHSEKLTKNGYSLFLFKEKILRAINRVWSIPNQEFEYKNGQYTIISVKFKEYDKMGEGGFCTVYQCSKDNTKVLKVLNEKEKSDVGSVHRFKREYDIMSVHNNSGYTLKVFDFDKQALVYSMERAAISLEGYLNESQISDDEKDEIIMRCSECMQYLHNHNVLHRDFHPGNILLGSNGWMVTDFGLAKNLSDKYSHQTTSTKQVGRSWFTDPIQIEHLKDGSIQTDMYSLAKTIDFIMNGNYSEASHKYSSIIYRATAPNPDYRYNDINEMCNDIRSICERTNYQSPEEKAIELLEKYKTGKNIVVELISALNETSETTLMWSLIVKFGNNMVDPFIKIVNVKFDIALREIRRVYDVVKNTYQDWNNYDTVAYWAKEIIYKRKEDNDDINIEAASIIDYVADSVNRFEIKKLSNRLKNDPTIDGHIRAKLSNYDGY